MFTESESLWDGIEGIVLDAVGTLIEPSPPAAEVYRAAARRQGVDLPGDEVRARFHRHFRNDEVDESLGPMRTDEPLEARRWRRIVAAVLPEVPDVERAFDELWAYFARPEAWRCFPDVAPAVRTLQGWGMRVRIGSNFDGRLRTVVAGLPALSALSDALVISSEVGLRKPHPGFYQAACASMALGPGRVLCLGDDPDNDVLGPRRAGLCGVLLDRPGRRAGIDGMIALTGLDELVAARDDDTSLAGIGGFRYHRCRPRPPMGVPGAADDGTLDEAE